MSRASRSAFNGFVPRSSFDSSPRPSAARPPPIRSPETSRTPVASARICRNVSSSGSTSSCETNRSPRTRRRGSSAKLVGETVRRMRRSRSSRPPNGSTRVPSESRRAIALIVKSRRDRSSSTVASGSTTISKSCRPGPVETSRRGGASSIPAGTFRRSARSAREETDADGAAGDVQLLRPPVGGECVAQAGDVDAGDEEVRVLRVASGELVADGAAHRVGVEPERADVILDLPGQARRSRRPRSRRARRTAASPLRPSRGPEAPRRRGGRTPRSSPRSRRDPGGRPWS